MKLWLCSPSWSFLLVSQMSAVGITENAKGDNKKFEIWCNSREEVFIVQVRGQCSDGERTTSIYFIKQKPCHCGCCCFSSRLQPQRLKQPGWTRSAKSWRSSSKPAEVRRNTQTHTSFSSSSVYFCVYWIIVCFRCQSAEELWLCLPESHQQHHLYLPQVGGSMHHLPIVHIQMSHRNHAYGFMICNVFFFLSVPVPSVAAVKRTRRSKMRRSQSWARCPTITCLPHRNQKVNVW